MVSNIQFIVNLFILLMTVKTSSCTNKCIHEGNWTGQVMQSFSFGSMPYCSLVSNPSRLGFSTTYRFLNNFSLSRPNQYSIRNTVPKKNQHSDIEWHSDLMDHTNQNGTGCMYLVNLNDQCKSCKIFNLEVDNLCVGEWYEFSGYVANIGKPSNRSSNPNIRFEISSASKPHRIFTQCETGEMVAMEKFQWIGYGIRFQANNSSINMAMTSNSRGNYGNDIAIDDIQLRVNTTNSLIVYSTTTTSTKSSTESSKTTITTSTTTSSTTRTSISTTTTTTTITLNELELEVHQPVECNDSSKISRYCNVSNNICAMGEPCKNNGTCYNSINNEFHCECQNGFNGSHCEFDHRPCKPGTCWNEGKCKVLSNTTFNCTCKSGWHGIHCEKKINLCETNPCQNKAICRTLFLNYSCKCLGSDFSGRHCEIISTKLLILNIVSKSFAYIAILAITAVLLFIIIMDILKYCFGIDPVEEERERMRRERKQKYLKNLRK